MNLYRKHSFLCAMLFTLATVPCFASPVDSTTPDAGVPEADGNVLAIAATATRIYVGGTFTMIGGVARNNLAAIDSATGEVDLAWNPNVNDSVYAIVVDDATGKVYVGGAFTTVNGGAHSRSYVAAFDEADSINNGAPDSEWYPQLDGAVRALAIGANNAVYVGGEFTQVVSDTATRNRLAAFSKADGSNEATLDPWNPNCNNSALALKIIGPRLYVGGGFSTVLGGTVTRNGLAAFNLADGSSAAAVDTAWDPNIGGFILAIEYVDSHVVAGGSFTTVLGGASRPNLAVFTPADGSTPAALQSTWGTTADNWVKSIVASNGKVYLGGDFQYLYVGITLPYKRLGAVDSPGAPSPGYPELGWMQDVDQRVMALAIDPTTGGLLVGGNFTTLNGAARAHLAGFGTAMATRLATNAGDSGPGSLRQVIADAAPGETIRFSQSLAGQTLTLTSGEILIDKNLTLEGLGMNNLTLSGNDASRVFRIAAGATVRISDLTLANGAHVAPALSPGQGGAVYNEGNLTLEEVTIRNSVCKGTGGMYFYSPPMTPEPDTSGYGGGVYNSGTLKMERCRVVENTAEGRLWSGSNTMMNYRSPGFGGGIWNNGELTIDQCELASNRAVSAAGSGSIGGGSSRGEGGGLFNVSGAFAVLLNSTFSGNSAEGVQSSSGGGVYCGKDTLVYLCTIAFNEVLGDASTKKGGGIYSPESTMANAPTLGMTIIANNSGASGGNGTDLFGQFLAGHSLIGASGGYTVTLIGDVANLVGQNPKLRPLQWNGGPTRTHAVEPGSPALDAISSFDLEEEVTTDQRGKPRPWPAGGMADIGAYEAGSATRRTVVNANDSGAGSLRQVLAECAGGDTVDFDSGLRGQTIVLTSGELLIDRDLTLEGLGMSRLTVSGNDASRVFRIAAGATVRISDLTLANGAHVAPALSPGQGGAVYNEGNLTLEEVTIRNSVCKGTGGMYFYSPPMTPEPDTSGYGGGVYNSGTLKMERCRVVENTAQGRLWSGSNTMMNYRSPGFGGGIWSNGTLTIDQCELASNHAVSEAGSGSIGGGSSRGEGGGLFNVSGAFAVLLNSTFSGNSAEGVQSSSGGGVYCGKDTLVYLCTVAYNEVLGDSSTKKGGGIYSPESTMANAPTLGMTIIANNSGASADNGTDLFGQFLAGHSLIGASGGYTVTLIGVVANLVGQNPKLRPLQWNGGPTRTHAVEPGSPALDAISSFDLEEEVTTDQRGKPRPWPAGGMADIGAYEHSLGLTNAMNWTRYE